MEKEREGGGGGGGGGGREKERGKYSFFSDVQDKHTGAFIRSSPRSSYCFSSNYASNYERRPYVSY